jgi:hypothetical protein
MLLVQANGIAETLIHASGSIRGNFLSPELSTRTVRKMDSAILTNRCSRGAQSMSAEIIEDCHMSNKRLFVEQRPEGDYAVRKPNSDRASAVLPTQAEAIERARQLNPGEAPLVERVRYTSGGKPDKWRKP